VDDTRRKTHVFVVRLWREPREVDRALPEWRGTIKNVRTDEQRSFRHLRTMVDFIVESAGARTMLRRPSSAAMSGAAALGRLALHLCRLGGWPR
jgi:hypothetical protein